MKIIGTTLNAKYIHTNLALRFLKAYAEPEFNVEIIEYTIKDPVLNIVTDLMKHDPDVIGFSCYIWNMEQIKQISSLIKKIKPSVKIILGGPEVSYEPDYWMNEIKAVDAIVIGEGEATFKELLINIKNNMPFDKIKGLVARVGEEIITNERREKLCLNEVPSPYHFDNDVQNLPSRITYFETSRGCPFNCQFCLSSLETGVRYFDRDSAKEDLLFLINNGVKTIKFMDRTFNTDRAYALDIFKFIIEHHRPGMSVQFEITADIMKPELIEYLNENAPAGLFRFEIGIQSTNEHTNKLVNRRQNFEKLKNIVMMIKEGGKIEQHLDLIAGLPEEDYASFRKTFNDVFEMRPEELQLGFLKMLRGTGIRRDAEKYGYIFMDEAPYEIVANNVLSFEDVARIKQVEDVLEKFWNDHRMDLSIEYLITNVFETPFDFFQEFGGFWERKGWSRIGHQLESLFNRLVTFISETHPAHLENLLDIMKHDYLSRLTHKPRSFWWDESLNSDDKKRITERLLEDEHFIFDRKTFVKHCDIFEMNVDVEAFKNEGLINCEPYLMVVYFNPMTKETAFFKFETV